MRAESGLGGTALGARPGVIRSGFRRSSWWSDLDHIELLLILLLCSWLIVVAAPFARGWVVEAANARAMDDLHAVARSQQAFFAEKGRYASGLEELRAGGMPGPVELRLERRAPDRFLATARHPSGDRTFLWSSRAGD